MEESGFIEMEKEEKRPYKAHCLVLPYPAQGHINPMLQFSERLEHKGVKITVATTHFISKTIHGDQQSMAVETISDGYDQGGISEAESIEVYLKRFRLVGSKTLLDLLEKLKISGCPVDCVIYDAVLPWALDVAKKFGLLGVAFLTQSCAVKSIYYHAHQGLLKLPLSEKEVLLPGLPPLTPLELPYFLVHPQSYPAFLDLVLNQFENFDKADWVLCNTFYQLEEKVADWLAKFWPLMTIGPTLPSMYLDKKIQDDDLNLFKQDSGDCMKWLSKRPNRSVVYVSFGSMAALNVKQMEELACGLKDSSSYFLWVVRESEKDKLPRNFVDETSERGLVVSWCPQLDVLSHGAIGCFVTHCGWNSTLEAVSLGVPMVAMPQWTDQATNAKYITDVWRVGLRAWADEDGIVTRKVTGNCIREVMEGERAEEIKRNAIKWRNVARESVDQGGSSDRNIDEFVSNLIHC